MGNSPTVLGDCRPNRGQNSPLDISNSKLDNYLKPNLSEFHVQSNSSIWCHNPWFVVSFSTVWPPARLLVRRKKRGVGNAKKSIVYNQWTIFVVSKFKLSLSLKLTSQSKLCEWLLNSQSLVYAYFNSLKHLWLS